MTSSTPTTTSAQSRFSNGRYTVFDHSFFAWWMSEWQTPQNST
jgi:hypothetical protein